MNFGLGRQCRRPQQCLRFKFQLTIKRPLQSFVCGTWDDTRLFACKGSGIYCLEKRRSIKVSTKCRMVIVKVQCLIQPKISIFTRHFPRGEDKILLFHQSSRDVIQIGVLCLAMFISPVQMPEGAPESRNSNSKDARCASKNSQAAYAWPLRSKRVIHKRQPFTHNVCLRQRR